MSAQVLDTVFRDARIAARRGAASEGEKAALRWLERYLIEGSPRLQHFAEITTSLAKREYDAGGAELTCWVGGRYSTGGKGAG